MNFYILNTLGQYDENRYCHSDSIAEGVVDINSALENGGDLTSEYPQDPYEVVMCLDEDSPKHIKIGSFLSTTDDYVMVHKDVIDVLKHFNIGEVDFWPFTLLNHKGRVHSQDYRFVVPKKSFDAIHEELSKIDRGSTGVCIGFNRIVLDTQKLKNAPDMFRVNDVGLMAFSEPLANKLKADCTNFVFDLAEQH